MNQRAVQLLLFFFALQALCAAQKQKKLIEFGWDEPGTSFMREHITEMEKAPFDGVVFDADAVRPNGSKARFTWDAWGTNRFDKPSVQRAIDDLRATKFQRFTDNFLRFNTTPGKLDWFDDYSAIIHNCRTAAWLVKQGGARGILFDIEQYEGQLFDFRQRRDKAKSWDDYAKQIRLRGREVMAAFQEELPDPVIFLTFGYSLPAAESQNGKRPLAECHYGMLAPFLDGMLDAATGRALLIDGNEGAYGFRDTNRIAASYRNMKHDLLPIVADPAKYPRHVSVSFGLWMDYDWRKRGWDVTNVATNYYTPDGFARTLRTALEAADDYVWIYTEQPRWWTKEGTTAKLPASYADAVLRARTEAAK